jgi:isocitrate/isopropylmalate dehydrogenase
MPSIAVIAGDGVRKAVVPADGVMRTGDLGGSASTEEVADAVISALRTPAQARTSETGDTE